MAGLLAAVQISSPLSVSFMEFNKLLDNASISVDMQTPIEYNNYYTDYYYLPDS